MLRFFSLAPLFILASCSSTELLPSWQQDTGLIYNEAPSRLAQQSSTPHVVARAVYTSADRMDALLASQDDSAELVKGPVVMGDGTFSLGVQDALSGQWLETRLCGGQLFITGQPGQAYKLHLRNLTPQPLDLAIGIDGKDLMTGKPASWTRSSLRADGKKTLILPAPASDMRAPVFKRVTSDHALHVQGSQGTTGLIQVAAWLAADAPSLPGQKLRAGQVLPLSLYPFETPEQYR